MPSVCVCIGQLSQVGITHGRLYPLFFQQWVQLKPWRLIQSSCSKLQRSKHWRTDSQYTCGCLVEKFSCLSMVWIAITECSAHFCLYSLMTLSRWLFTDGIHVIPNCTPEQLLNLTLEILVFSPSSEWWWYTTNFIWGVKSKNILTLFQFQISFCLKISFFNSLKIRYLGETVSLLNIPSPGKEDYGGFRISDLGTIVSHSFEILDWRAWSLLLDHIGSY